jgi:hypothetical protein
LLERLLPAPVLEHALGDLAEEYVLRVDTSSSHSAGRWYWMQIVRSVPVLFGHALRSAGTLRTLAVAVALYLGASVVESLALGGISLLALSDPTRTVVSAIVGIATIGCAGYVAARIQRPAAPVLAAITLAVVLVLMLTSGDAAPLWYQIAFLVAGPIAPIAGGVVASRHHLRQARPRAVH